MPSHNNNNSAFDTILSIMGGGTPSGNGRLRSGDVNINNGDGQTIIPILCLLATDVLAGVGLRSALRSFLRSHVSLIEFSTGIELNVHQLERPEERSVRVPNLLPLPLEGSQQDDGDLPFIVEIKGLRNRGQTCYANSVIQALASLQPLYTYLQSVQQNVQSNTSSGQGCIALALLQTLQYVNGHDEATTTAMRIRRRSFFQLFSSSSSGGVQRILDIVAKHHSQFRSRNNLGMGGTLEQQDSHEFFSALMDVLSSENQDGGGGSSTLGTITKGLACGNSFFQSDDGNEDMSDFSAGICHDVLGRDTLDSGNQYAGGSNHANNDEFEEEKKHEEQNIGDPASGGLGLASFDDPSKDTRQIHRKESQTPGISTTPEHVLTTSDPAESTPGSTLHNPFDGWYGSTVKCATCLHVRPIRSTPFLGLSLPITNIQSEYLEDFLASEYGGFASAERVQDVQCLSCAIKDRISELEEEEMLINGAISSIRRRKKAKKMVANGSGRKVVDEQSDDNIDGLLQESQQLKRKVDILRSIDPDADDDKLECNDENSQHEFEFGINNSLPPLTPLRGDAYKASLIMRPPEVLCIHIQRRSYDMSCQRMVKVMRHVHFNEALDIGAFCAYGQRKILYKLMSVIEHKGNAFGGHYQTYRRAESTQNEWVLVSDESVLPRTWNDVRMCQAYMLFYVAASKGS